MTMDLPSVATGKPPVPQQPPKVPHLKSPEYHSRNFSPTKLDEPYKKSNSNEYPRKRVVELKQEIIDYNSPKNVKEYRLSVLLLVALTTLLIVLIGITIYMYSKQFPADELVRPVPHARDVRRRRVVVMSDNLECSIYMKFLFMQNVDPRHVMLHGMMCLSITEPHTAAPDSAVSTLWFYRQGKESMTENDLSRTLNIKKCGLRREKGCELGSYLYVQGVYRHKKHWIYDSEIHSQYVMHGQNFFKTFYQRYFTVFFGAGDHGPSVPYFIEYTKGYHRSRSAEKTPNVLRSFRVSNLMKKFLNFIKNPNFFSQSWMDMFGYRDDSELRKNDVIRVTKDVAASFMEHFFVTDKKQSELLPNNGVSPLHFDAKVANFSIAVVADDTTLGFVAKHVLVLVHEVNRRKTLTEPAFYAAVLRAQKLAYYDIELDTPADSHPLTDEAFWTEFENTVSYVQGELDKEFRDSMNCTMLMKSPSRTATIINWVEKGYSFLNIINVALPDIFGSLTTQRTPKTPYPRFECGGYRSRKRFTSAASLVITKNSENRKFVTGSMEGAKLYTIKPWIAVSASGSIRNVEAVAITALRILLFGESPAQAVNAPGAYYDVRDGKFYCDKGRSEETKKMFEKMEKEFHLECLPVPEKEFMANDRVAMAAQMGHRQNDYIRSAVDGRALDFNYPTGF